MESKEIHIRNVSLNLLLKNLGKFHRNINVQNGLTAYGMKISQIMMDNLALADGERLIDMGGNQIKLTCPGCIEVLKENGI